MAISTYQTYLMYKATSSGSYTKLIDITSFPDLIPSKDRIDVTSLSNNQRTYIPGIGDTAEMTFGANYTATDFATVQALEGTQYDFAVWFGAATDSSTGVDTPDGHNGKFSWKGEISVSVNGGGVNEAVGMTITATPATDVEFSAS